MYGFTCKRSLQVGKTGARLHAKHARAPTAGRYLPIGTDL